MHQWGYCFSLLKPSTDTPSKLTECSERPPPFSPPQPTRGKEALALLYPDGGAVGPPRQAEMQARCSPGLLRKIFLEYKTHDCACRHELAVNGLTDPRLRFQDITTLGQGGFGTVYRSRCNKTRKEYAIKTAKPVSSDCWKEGRSSVWRRLVFRNLYSLPKVWRWCRDRYVYAWGKIAQYICCCCCCCCCCGFLVLVVLT